MKYLKVNSFIFAFIFLLGSMFMIQCERADRGERADRVDQEETYDQRERPPAQPGEDFETTDPRTDQLTQQDRPMQDVDEQTRQQLIAELTELQNDIEMELNQLRAREDLTDVESERADQYEDDIDEIDSTIEDLQDADQDNWNEVRAEAQDLLERIRAGFESNDTTTTGQDATTTGEN